MSVNNLYKATIGLEIHAELKTKTKMFCDSRNDPEEKRPNVNICPVCMAHPGTLPVINKEAVKHVVKVGLALGGTIADFTEFDRKNYFYPDIPKGYQISQYKYPLVLGGSLNGIQITRVHLEEDTARSSHDRGDFSLIDFNRAGVPLMELVTEPVIHDAETAVRFGKELQLLLRYLGAGEANMEKGEMRVEANISVAPEGKRGTKVEVKNLNSFKVVSSAIAYEIKRQSDLIDSGGKVVQETRGWDEAKQKTFSQRLKEDSHDYRYFPDPDLPKLYISEIPEFDKSNLKKELPELPWGRRERYLSLGLKKEDAEMFVSDRRFGDFFDSTAAFLEAKPPKILMLAVNYISSDLAGLIKNSEDPEQRILIDPKNFGKLIKMVAENEVSSRGAKDILSEMFAKDNNPEVIAKEKKLLQQSDEGMIKKIAEEVIAENEKVVGEYRAGKESSLQFLVGQGMKKSKGSANPQILKEILTKLL